MSEFDSQASKEAVACGMVFETIWFSTDRSNIDAMGMMKVITTNKSSGAISASARSFWRLNARARLIFNGVPSAASIGPEDVVSLMWTPSNITYHVRLVGAGSLEFWEGKGREALP